MSKTYSEARQAAYFIAARSLIKVATGVYDDCCNPSDADSRQTIHWTIQTAKNTADQARALETLGYEQCISSGHASTANAKAWFAMSQAISRFEKRVLARYPEAATLGVPAWAEPFSSAV